MDESALQTRGHDLSILSAIKHDTETPGRGLIDSLLYEDDGTAGGLLTSDVRPVKSPAYYELTAIPKATTELNHMLAMTK